MQDLEKQMMKGSILHKQIEHAHSTTQHWSLPVPIALAHPRFYWLGTQRASWRCFFFFAACLLLGGQVLCVVLVLGVLPQSAGCRFCLRGCAAARSAFRTAAR